MTNPVLLLRLEAPMQSWGTRSRWDVRETGAEPTKSGVVGLVGCALGVPRRSPDLENLDRALRFGVRVEMPGILGRDFHTVTGCHRLASGKVKFGESTVVSPREYLYDAAFLVALESDDHDLLARIAGEKKDAMDRGSLKAPRWPLYLGRKSCVPSRPVLERLALEYSGMEEALKREPWMPSCSLEKMPSRLIGWIECSSGEYERQDALRQNPFRFYGYRRCRKIDIETASLEPSERTTS